MPRLSYSHRAFLLLATLVATLSCAYAFPARNQHKRDVRAEVEAVDKQWHTAELANDTAVMEKLLAEDYVGVTAGGRVLTKAQQLDRMRSRKSNIARLDMTEQKIKMAGGNVAIVTSLAELEGTADGHPIHGQFRSIRVYQHVPGGGWQITNFEATPLRGVESTPAGYAGPRR